MKRKKIAIRLLITCYVITFLIGGTICALSYYTYQTGMINSFQGKLRGMLEAVTYECNVDKLEKAIIDCKENDEYKVIKKSIDTMKQTQDIENLILVVPLNTDKENNMKYVMVAQSNEEKESKQYKRNALGNLSKSDFSSEMAKNYLDCFNNADSITYISDKSEFGYSYVGLLPIKNSKKEPICVISASVSMDEVRNAMMKYMHLVIIGALVITDIFIAFIYGWLIRKLINPLTYIEMATADFIRNAKDASVPENITYIRPEIFSNDEFEVINEQVDVIANEMKRYMVLYRNEVIQKGKAGDELENIKCIQKKIVPKMFIVQPAKDEVDFSYVLFGKKEFAKVFHESFVIDDDHLGFIVMEFLEESLTTTMYMFVARSIIRNYGSLKKDGAQIFDIMCNQLFLGMDDKMSFNVMYYSIELSTGKISLVNAGVDSPIIRKKDGLVEKLNINSSASMSQNDNVVFVNNEYQLEKGDRFFVVTSGISRAKDDNGEIFGIDRIIDSLRKDDTDDIYEMMGNVKKVFDRFVNVDLQTYDMVMTGMEYRG